MFRSSLIAALILVLVLFLPVRASDLPEEAFVDGVVGYPQSFSLSCESRSAVDWAAFWGVEIGEVEFLDGLPVSDNPDLGFVGNPRDVWGYTPPNSYGVHAAPVAALLRQYGLSAEARSGLSWDELRAEIAAGRPVIVWVISEMWPGRPVRYTASSGETVIVAAFEHTMILTGYTATSVRMQDAYSGLERWYSVDAFLTSWETLGNMAVTGGPAEVPPEASPTANPSPTPTPTPEPPKLYEVQPGDLLIAIAHRLDITWQALAEANRLAFPYALQPGQVLKVGGEALFPEEPASSTAGFPMPVLHLSFYGPLPAENRVYMAAIFNSPLLPTQVISSEEDSASPTPEAAFYVVQPGEYLTQLAVRFDIPWQELAALNNIPYPYTLFAGQTLKLK